MERQDRRVEDSGNQDVSACQVTAAAGWFLNQEPSSQRIQELALGYTGQEPDKASLRYLHPDPALLCEDKEFIGEKKNTGILYHNTLPLDEIFSQ